MVIFISAVTSGKLNGQLTTVRAVCGLLDKKYTLHILSRNLINNIRFIYYLPLMLAYKLIGKEFAFYIFIHRTRFGFYIRDLPVFIIALLFRRSYVIHIVGSDVEIFLKRITVVEKYLIKLFYSRADSIVVLGSAMKSQVNNCLSSFYTNMNYAIAPGIFDQTYNQFNITNNGKRLYHVGFMSNFIYEKGICEYIDAVIHCNENYGISVNAWIAGQYLSSDDRIDKKIKLAKSKSYFKFYDVIQGEIKWKLLMSTMIYVLPTYYETESLPLSLVDAMVSGCVCISSDVGEIKELLSENRGVIVNPKSYVDIANTIIDLLIDESKMSEIAKDSEKYVKEMFSINKYSNSIYNAIESTRTNID